MIRDVDAKIDLGAGEEVAALAERARDKQLKPDEMQGGVFTGEQSKAAGGRGLHADQCPDSRCRPLRCSRFGMMEVFRPATMLLLALLL